MAARPGATILVVEDHTATATFICSLLELDGYATLTARNGRDAIGLLRDRPSPSLVVLDLMLPDVDGLVLFDDIRDLCDAPVIVCSGTDRKRDALLALRLGADDVITKPFDTDEFCERVTAALRRADSGGVSCRRGLPASHQHRVRRVGSLVIDEAKREASLAHQPLHLTPIEYRLLHGFLLRPDEVLTRADLARLGWGDTTASVGRAIDVHIRRLRAKLDGAGARDLDIITVRAIGYKLVRRSAALLA